MGKKEAGSTTMCTYDVGSYRRQIAHLAHRIFQKDASFSFPPPFFLGKFFIIEILAPLK